MKTLLKYLTAENIFNDTVSVKTFCEITNETLEVKEVKKTNLLSFINLKTCQHTTKLLNAFHMQRYSAYQANRAFTETHLKEFEKLRIFIPVAANMLNSETQMFYIVENILPAMKLFWPPSKQADSSLKWSKLINLLENNASNLKNFDNNRKSFQNADTCKIQKMNV